MSFVTENKITPQTLKEQFKPGTFVIILEENQDIQNDLAFFFKTATQLKNKNFFSVVSSQAPNIPFLSIRENIFLGSTNKQRQTNLNDLENWLALLEIDQGILDQHFEDLSFKKNILFQLIRGLIRGSEMIIFDDVFDDLSVQTTQQLLPFLRKIAKEKLISILVLTNNPEIANCSFSDLKIVI